MKNIYILIGTRPNFIKVTQFKKVAEQKHKNLTIKVIHTGQHYDEKMADIFFSQFSLTPDFYLNIKPASPNHQIAEIMIKLEELFFDKGLPDLLIVPGDVNSTLAGALTANKLGIKLAHLESGLRSNDRDMPEEWNRLLVDEMSDFYFVTEYSGKKYLQDENKKGEIHFVGNTMIDTLVAFKENINSSQILKKLDLDNKRYILATIHRPSNVDTKEGLDKLYSLLTNLKKYKIVFPIHPRTKNKIKEFNLEEEFSKLDNLIDIPPTGYFDFQKLVKESQFVLTDSGGIQEETTFLQKPCLTLRENTERPSTINQGTNSLVPFNVEVILDHITQIENSKYKKGSIPKFWDGKSTERILDIISSL